MPARQEKSVRPAASSSAPKTSLPSHASPAVKAGTESGGQRLDKHTSAEMSAKFGHDFSQVRIHTDHRAGDAAEAMGANAYALGGDIVFGAGQYNPGSRETDRLLAHELTHVVQQAQFGPGDWGRTSGRSDASEREADSLASQTMRGQSVNVQAAPQAAVARDENDAQSSWLGNVFGGGSGGGAASAGPSAAQSSWVNNVFGNDAGGDAGGAAASGPSAAQSSWVNDVFGGSGGGGAASGASATQSSWAGSALGVDPSAY
jgi:hypothetical protein